VEGLINLLLRIILIESGIEIIVIILSSIIFLLLKIYSLYLFLYW